MAIKRNEMMPFAEMWLDLENVIWNEVRKRMPYFCVWILDPPRSAAGKG